MKKVIPNKVAVYFHLNPITGIPFYVGIGVKFRPYRTSGRSVLWNRHVEKYGFHVKIVELFDTWNEAQEKEKYYIKFYGRIDKKTGCLVNHTDGGDGALGNITNIGKKHSEESKLKRSIALKGRKPSKECTEGRKLAGYKAWNKGIPMREESKERLSESKKGITLSEEHRNKISEKLKGRVFSEETKRKNSESLKGRIKSDEHKRKLSEAAKKQWQSGNTWHNKKAA